MLSNSELLNNFMAEGSLVTTSNGIINRIPLAYKFVPLLSTCELWSLPLWCYQGLAVPNANHLIALFFFVMPAEGPGLIHQVSRGAQMPCNTPQ